MLYVASGYKELMDFVRSHPQLKLRQIPNKHFSEMKKFAKETDWIKSNYYTFETVLPDYVDPINIKYVVDKDTAENFNKYFSDMIGIMYPGEILLNYRVNSSIEVKPRNKSNEKHNKPTVKKRNKR